ncbi:MAG TPA: hypothetical protein PKD55_01300 [Bellilinea sp.]|nr:hypothetical protein [Bellilinea sp.]
METKSSQYIQKGSSMSTEASALGLKPGDVPKHITINFPDGRVWNLTYHRAIVRSEEVVGWLYFDWKSYCTATVYND